MTVFYSINKTFSSKKEKRVKLRNCFDRFLYKVLLRRESEKRVSFHINFYSDWNVFYDDDSDFTIQIIKHASCCSEVAISPIVVVGCCQPKGKRTVREGSPEKQPFGVVSCGVNHLIFMHKKNNMLREKRKHANYKPNRR